jgi:hypothetical protein
VYQAHESGSTHEGDRAIWDQLSDDPKIAILGTRSQTKPRTNSTRLPGKRLVQLCDVLQAFQHLSHDPGEETPDTMIEDSGPDPHLDEQPPEDNPGQPDLLTFATNRADSESIPPAHLARMMSDAVQGEYEKRTILYHNSLVHVPVLKVHSIHVNAGRTVEHSDVEYKAMRPKFGWLPTDIIREIVKRMTQYVRLPGSEILKKRHNLLFLT